MGNPSKADARPPRHTGIAVVGPGAVGGTIAAVAQRAGHSPLLCGRTPAGRLSVEQDDRPPVLLDQPVITDPEAVTGPVGWLLLAVKAHQTDSAAPWLRALAGPGTTVVTLQNGVEHGAAVARYVGQATVLPTVVWFPAEVVAPGRIRVRGVPLLTVPDVPAGHELAELLVPGGARVEPVADFTTAMWHKLVINAVAGFEVLTDKRAEIYRRPDVHRLARDYAAEVIAVARAAGAAIEPADADRIADRFARMRPEIGTSMLYDRRAGRPLEWEARNGVVQRLGARHGIPTPISDVLVPLLAASGG